MIRFLKIAVYSLFMACMLLGTAASPVFARADEDLRIGVPDFPRSVPKELPDIKKGEELKLGVLKLHPSFIQKVEYDDNIRLSQTDEKEDIIFTSLPAGAVEVDLGDHRFEGGYGMEIVEFVKDNEEDAVNHLANGLLELNFNDLHITLEDAFENSTTRQFNETSARDNVIYNASQAIVLYDRPKWAGEVAYRHNRIDHRRSAFEVNDYHEDIIAVLGGYKFLPKTLFLIENDFGFINYDEKTSNADAKYWQILGGIRGEPTNRLTTTIKAGFQDRRLEDVAGQGKQTDFDGFVMLSDFVYKISANDSVRGGYTRTIKTSTFAGNSWYKQDRIFVSYRKRLAQKWYLTPETAWQRNDYPEGATINNETRLRDDNFWYAKLDLRYQIKDWLSTGMIYNYRMRSSNFDTFDYENNRVIWDVSLTF